MKNFPERLKNARKMKGFSLQEREELGKPDFEVSTLEELEAKLAVGVEQLERGEGIPGDKVFAELKEHSRRRRAHA